MVTEKNNIILPSRSHDIKSESLMLVSEITANERLPFAAINIHYPKIQNRGKISNSPRPLGSLPSLTTTL